MFLEILQNLQENNCVTLSFLIKLQWNGKYWAYNYRPMRFSKLLKICNSYSPWKFFLNFSKHSLASPNQIQSFDTALFRFLNFRSNHLEAILGKAIWFLIFMSHFPLIFPVSFTDIFPKNFLGCYIIIAIENRNFRTLRKNHKAKQLLPVIISAMTSSTSFTT